MKHDDNEIWCCTTQYFDVFLMNVLSINLEMRKYSIKIYVKYDHACITTSRGSRLFIIVLNSDSKSIFQQNINIH